MIRSLPARDETEIRHELARDISSPQGVLQQEKYIALLRCGLFDVAVSGAEALGDPKGLSGKWRIKANQK